MNDRCEPIETLRQAAALPAGDPRRDHVEACPRCAARLAALASFLDGGDVPAGADPDAADRRLAAALRDERNRRSAGGRRFGAGLLALAAVLLLLVVGPGLLGDHEGPPASGTLRGDAAPDAFALRAEGRTLSWNAIPGADAYEVILYDDSLAPLGEPIAIRGATSLELDLDGPAPAYWRVTARRGGDPLASSPAVPYPG